MFWRVYTIAARVLVAVRARVLLQAGWCASCTFRIGFVSPARAKSRYERLEQR